MVRPPRIGVARVHGDRGRSSADPIDGQPAVLPRYGAATTVGLSVLLHGLSAWPAIESLWPLVRPKSEDMRPRRPWSRERRTSRRPPDGVEGLLRRCRTTRGRFVRRFVHRQVAGVVSPFAGQYDMARSAIAVIVSDGLTPRFAPIAAPSTTCSPSCPNTRWYWSTTPCGGRISPDGGAAEDVRGRRSCRTTPR